MSDRIKVQHLGLMKYGEALNIQERSVMEVSRDQLDGVIFSVEHYPVLTLGKNSSPSHLLFSRDVYQQIGVEIFETERGGEVTAHMPGQLVLYPILNMSKMNLSVRNYVQMLEEAVILTLEDYGVSAARDAQYPGVWIGASKICAIGVRIKSRISMHGLALNVSNDLSLFGKIVPCGIKFRGVTSLQKQIDHEVSMADVRSRLLDKLQHQLGKLLF